MALQQSYTYNQYTYDNAYIKAHIGRATVEQTTIMVYIWPSRQDRLDNKPPICTDVYIFDTDFNLASGNPIEYVYNLLKTSNTFENATDIYE